MKQLTDDGAYYDASTLAFSPTQHQEHFTRDRHREEGCSSSAACSSDDLCSMLANSPRAPAHHSAEATRQTGTTATTCRPLARQGYASPLFNDHHHHQLELSLSVGAPSPSPPHRSGAAELGQPQSPLARCLGQLLVPAPHSSTSSTSPVFGDLFVTLTPLGFTAEDPDADRCLQRLAELVEVTVLVNQQQRRLAHNHDDDHHRQRHHRGGGSDNGNGEEEMDGDGDGDCYEQTAEEEDTTFDLHHFSLEPPVMDLNAGSITHTLQWLFRVLQVEPQCAVGALVYLQRVVAAGVRLTERNYEPLLVGAVLLASKVWDDLSTVNVDFAAALPHYSLRSLARLEVLLLKHLDWRAGVSRSEYTRAYFDLTVKEQVVVTAGEEEEEEQEVVVAIAAAQVTVAAATATTTTTTTTTAATTATTTTTKRGDNTMPEQQVVEVGDEVDEEKEKEKQLLLLFTSLSS
jgi:hypothetical protein